MKRLPREESREEHVHVWTSGGKEENELMYVGVQVRTD